MKANQVRVTTTAGFDGIKIEKYMEPITAHVVVGMNFFRDFLSGFTDVFGGKSNVYQNTLAAINEEVINELRKKAFSMGANCVLGLKIDNDEVAAQGKSMMMVTALGTAAYANFPSSAITVAINNKVEKIDDDLLKFYKLKRRYLAEIQESYFYISDDFWKFIKTNKVEEFTEILLEKYLLMVETKQDFEIDQVKNFANNLNEYYSLLEPEYTSDILYRRLYVEEKRKSIGKISEQITLLKFIDFEKIFPLLTHPSFIKHKYALKLLSENKALYQKADIDSITNTISYIEKTFVERGKRSSRKKMLSSKEKEIWICECGKENDIETGYCSSCSMDIYGFGYNDIKPKEIIQKLSEDLEILEKTLKY